MSKRILAIGVIALCWAAHVAAQSVERRLPTGLLPGPPSMLGPRLRGGFDILAVEPLDLGEPVTDAPFSAEAVTEMTQQLADGNRLERRSSSAIARDSHGRVRREQMLMTMGPFFPQSDARIVTISDPVQQVLYMLDARRKVAVRSRPPGLSRSPARRLAPEPSGRQAPFGMSSQIQTERLPPMDVAGIGAEGTRTKMTIPTGAVGNERPIEVVAERWYSSDLRIVVSSKRSDPLYGEVTYRLTNIVRGEPSEDLFAVPSDYTIEDRPAPGIGVPR